MRKLHALISLTVMIFFVPTLRAQMIAGDSSFPVLNKLHWEMNATEIRQICTSQAEIVKATDSTVAFRAVFFGFSARPKIQFDRASQRPIFVDIPFEESSSAVRDTLINHFTAAVGKKPLITTREKSVLIFTIKMEMASWVFGKDMINIITMVRGSEILGVSLTLTQSEKGKQGAH